MASKGVLLFAVNNNIIDYVRLACLNARFIQKHMGVPVTLVTDEEGSTHPSVTDQFDQIIVTDSTAPSNPRVYRDTIYHLERSDFKNSGRPTAYELSPYDETIIVDVDYLIQSDILNKCWGSKEDILINNDALSLLSKPLTGNEYRLSQYGIRMFWATVVYFKKCELAETVFEMVKHIKDHWAYYKLVYDFPSEMYRNDYAFSIALHTIGGFQDDTRIKPLPVPYILSATDKDQLYKVDGDALVMFANDPVHDYKFYLTRLTGMNIHCMNKFSLARHIEALEQMV